MKIIWITNGIQPAMRKALGMNADFGGSWLIEPLRMLSEKTEYKIHVVTPHNVQKMVHKSIGNVEYYLIPASYMDRMKRPSAKYQKICKQFIDDISPDVIHIHGGEFAGSIPFAEYPGVPKVLSIQGIISKINADYFYGGIQVPGWLSCFLPWNIRTYLPMKLQHWRNTWRAKSEIRQMKQIDGITGCTRWDYTYSMLINENLKYYPVDYALRREFYESKWDVNQCTRHTFLLGNMAVPLKGAHRALDALAILIKKYPDAKMCVVGSNTFSAKHKFGYNWYLYKKAKKMGLLDHILPLGPQDTNGMVRSMLNVHTYVLSSCIENGPNTMMEAMSLGVPCVCSYVGGAMQFAQENKEALFYRFEEPEILAYELDRIWQNDELARSLSENARQRAKRFETFKEVYEKYDLMYHDLASGNRKVD